MSTNMKKTYLITGGQGFIGKAISLSLLDQGNKVIIFDNNFRKKKFFLKHKNLQLIDGDIRNIIHLNKINCYSNEANRWEKSNTIISGTKLSIKFRAPFEPRRGRVNCSLNDKGKWRWFGTQFTIVNN